MQVCIFLNMRMIIPYILPVSDRNVAKLLNVNGDVMIGNEVINMKDIFTYENW